MDDTERIVTCPRCCAPYVERLNAHTYRCQQDKRTFNVQSIGRGSWVDSNTWLRHVELYQGPVAGLRGHPRPLNYDGAAVLAWLTGRVWEHRSDGTTKLWVTEECNCP